MSVIAIYADHNTGGKRDSSGAFEPEARRFARLHGGVAVPFDNRASKAQRRAEVERLIWETSVDSYDCVALFCHGYRLGMQTGHDRKTVDGLAEVIGLRCAPGAPIALYACDAARDADRDRKDDNVPGPAGEGGFADLLRDALLERGYQGGHVDAHTTVAHTTRNPFVRRFYVDPEARDSGGDWLVAPGSPLWARWRRVLWEKAEPRGVRFLFPFMSVAELHAALAGEAAAA